MGNTHSSVEASAKRPTQRLSKPRTSNHTTAGLLSPMGASNNTRRLSNPRLSAQIPPPTPFSDAFSPATAAPSEVTGQPEEKVQRRASLLSVGREMRRRSLFRSKSSQGTKTSRRKSLVSGSGSMPGFLGRANSMVQEPSTVGYGSHEPEVPWVPPLPTTSSRMSWAYNMSSYEAKRLLNTLEEPVSEQDVPLSENRMIMVSELTWKSSHPPAQTNSTPISRANSDLSLYTTPMRRRSVILTPGVATRASPAPSSRPTFRFSHPPTPNMSRQPSFESHRSGVLSMPPLYNDTDAEPAPRAVTPCEDSYQAIGAFKLGTLRVTNGAASPVSPEVERNVREEQHEVVEPVIHEVDVDYFTGTEHASACVNMEQPRGRDTFNFDAEGENNHAIGDNLQQGVHLAELSFSPLDMEVIGLRAADLQTTSKHTAQEDQLFEDDIQPEYSSVEVLDVRLDHNAKSFPALADEEDLRKMVGRNDSGLGSDAENDPLSETAVRPLAKADSGYSSNVSVRSLRSKATEQAMPPPGQNTSQGGVEAKSAKDGIESLTSGLVKLIEEPVQGALPPPVPPKDHSNGSSGFKTGTSASRLVLTTGSHSTELQIADGAEKTKHTSAPIRGRRSGEIDSSSLCLISPLTPSSVKSAQSDTSNSALSIGSSSHKNLSKLQRFLSGARRSSSSPLTVHTTHVSKETSIPAIPQHLETKFHEHTGNFPMTTKRLALKPRSSKDTLKTILSVGSFEIKADLSGAVLAAPALLEVSSCEKEVVDGEAGSSISTTTQAETVTSSIPAMHAIPRKPIACKPTARHQDNVRPSEEEMTTMAKMVCQTENPCEISARNSGNRADTRGTTILAAAVNRHEHMAQSVAERTKSLSATMERRLSQVMVQDGLAKGTMQSNLLAPSPLLAREVTIGKTKTTPPVSMATRRPLSLRAPSFVRPQPSSGGTRLDAQPPKLYRGSVFGHLVTQEPEGHGFDRSTFPPPVLPMNSRRASYGQGTAVYGVVHKTPNWAVQADHGISEHSNPFEGVNRRRSLPASHLASSIVRPRSAQSWKQQPSQPLRHRSSYDGFAMDHMSLSQTMMRPMHTGRMPPTRPVFDPWSAGQYGSLAEPWDHYGRYPAPPPRHNRARSIGYQEGHSEAPPYRVLHSYNSPAYRNVPIWG